MDGHAGELLAQQLFGVHVLAVGRAARAVVHLFRPIALEEEQAARLEGAAHALEERLACSRWRELNEDRHDGVECALAHVKVARVFVVKFGRDAARRGEGARLLLRPRGDVHADHVQALFGHPDAVAPFAVGHGEHTPARLQPPTLAAEEGIGLGAEEIALVGVFGVPEAGGVVEFGHGGAFGGLRVARLDLGLGYGGAVRPKKGPGDDPPALVRTDSGRIRISALRGSCRDRSRRCPRSS